jgi:hypothetical protein
MSGFAEAIRVWPKEKIRAVSIRGPVVRRPR